MDVKSKDLQISQLKKGFIPKICNLLLPDFIIYGELGRYLLEIQIKTRMISYWSRILTGIDYKIAKLIYNLGISMNQEMGGGG